MQVQIVSRQHPRRAIAEAMVADVFSREYGARVSRFPDRMIVVFDGAGRPQCAAGMRDYGDGFFSEQYLDRPTERRIAERSGRTIDRREILELASLAALRPGGLLFLLRGFADYGLGTGYRWGLFTATTRLRQLAERFGISLLDLGAASADRVNDPQNWGSYYEHGPRVYAVDGPAARVRLETLSEPTTSVAEGAAGITGVADLEACL